MSPGRAASNAAAIASRRSAMSSRSWPRLRPADSAPRAIVIEDRLAILVARVLVGHDHEPSPLGGDPAHLRSFGRITLTGRSEDRDQPATSRRGRRRQQIEDGRQRRGAVREVDHDAERLAELDPLHATRHGGQAGEPLADARRIQPESPSERDDREPVVDVEPPSEAQIKRRVPVWRRDLRVQAASVLGDPGRAHVGGLLGAVRDHLRPGAARRADEHACRRVVEIDDRRRRHRVRLCDPARQPESIEQRQLRVAVRLPRPVELEMLVGHVGQDRDVVGDAGHALQGEPMGRRLDHGHASPASTMARNVAWSSGASGVVAWAAWSSVRPPIRVAIVPIIPVANPAASSAATAEIRGRGLPVGTGDPDDGQLVRRIAVPPGRGARRAPGGGIDHDLRRGDPGQRPLDDEPPPRRRSTAASAKSWPSACCPGIATNSEPGTHRARVVGHAA